ncbi:MAG: CPBP family intramembrane metalloprotease [Nanoarchaeota archaeon]|nr:CPBP family intramembrane metalloprotease [Nanoarchaeota archaeon]
MKIKYWGIFEIILFNFLFVLGLGWIWRALKQPGGLIMQQMFYIIVVFFIIFALKTIKNESFSGLGYRRPRKQDWMSGLYALLLLFPIAFIARLVDPSFDIWYASLQGLGTMAGVMIFISTLPFFALKEELLTRFVQTRLRGYGSMIAVIAVSINFGALHLFIAPGATYHGIISAVSVGIGAIFLAVLFEKTRNILVMTAVHMVFNAIITFQIFFHVATKWEWAFWTVYGILFLFALRPAWKGFWETFTEKVSWKELSAVDYLFLSFFALMLPAGLLAITYFF